MKEQKGITLVALIITIIVMLILVTVSVTVLIQSNILGSAKNAGKQWNNAQTSEAGNIKTNVGGKETTDLENFAKNYMNE